MAPQQARNLPKSEEHDVLRAHLLILYREYLKDLRPADQFLGGYLRKNKQIRGAARNFLAAVFFHLLRNRVSVLLRVAVAKGEPLQPVESLTSMISTEAEANLALLSWLGKEMNLPPEEALAVTLASMNQAAMLDGGRGVNPVARRQVEWFLTTLDRRNPGRILNSEERLALSTSTPLELVSRWVKWLGEKEARGLCEAMNRTAPLDLRVNTRLTTSKTVQEILVKNDLPCELSRTAPAAIRLHKKTNLSRVAGLEEGMVEVQDEGSQLVSEAVAPERGWRVLDACAGGGGKALHLSTMVGDEGCIYAHDLDVERMEPLKKRRRNAKAENIEILSPGSASEMPPFDAVLIDAPCVGLGRLRRDPAIAWRGGMSSRLAEATASQRQCLDSYSPLAKEGGVLVYAVCSFLEEETTAMIADFLSKHPEYEPDPLPALFQRDEFARTRSPDGSQVTLLPSLHGTDGFFLARLRKE